jgi:hypothetical protein
MTEFVEESYVNEFDQKIEPGEEVLYAGSSRKTTSIQQHLNHWLGLISNK